MPPRRRGRPARAEPSTRTVVLSQPSSAVRCTRCGVHRPLTSFRVNRLGAAFQPCNQCATVNSHLQLQRPPVNLF
jgi:hypothetical protein